MKRSNQMSFQVNLIPAVAVFAMALLASGCATPVGVRHLDPRQVQRSLTANVLSSDEVSAPTAQILNRADLKEKFRSKPAEVLATLHRGLPTASETDRLFALAELRSCHGQLRVRGDGLRGFFH